MATKKKVKETNKDYLEIYSYLLKSLKEIKEDEEMPEQLKDWADFFLINLSEDSQSEYVIYTMASSVTMCAKYEPLPKKVGDVVKRIYGYFIKLNDDGAMCDLGSFYYNGYFGKPDYRNALKYYRMSSALGNPIADENLGYIYYYGRDVKIDYKKAYHHFIKGYIRGLYASSYKIGDMYKNGYYVGKDEEIAFDIYFELLNRLPEPEESYIFERPDVYVRVADCLNRGIGVEKNTKEALKYARNAKKLFKERVDNGDKTAMVGLDWAQEIIEANKKK